ncbi:beta-glucosidase 42-like isoform X2 [Herrania umbratica]|uniref:Beta-glucosidase n=1 Tax=Herrania umbratica TaxID=108875 RepID=A0A6J1APV6_9ROSI|nr:beta-glucosidase 42-like isoform X2 [Herrania umbratica]
MAKRELLVENGEEVCRADFSPSFVFGVATSAYQIEGACSEGSRGASIWDSFSRAEGKIVDGSTGDVAVDHYHRYKEDVDLIYKFGFDAYRFSISWSRIFPDGLGTRVNDEGITFYNNLIDALLEKGIQPYVTLYHWDLPLHLHESIGGWLNKQIVYFAIYADTCFAHFGDRVKNWITINEPLQTAVNGYDTGIFAPGRCEGSSAEPYLAAHHQILAHATAVSIYRSKYKDKQGGQIGLVLDCEWAEPNSDKIEDKSAAARRLDFQFGWYMCPLYYGDYPAVMRERIGDRLPKFSQEEKELLGNSLDFIGLNHYTSRFIAHVKKGSEESFFYRAQEMERIVEWEGGEKIGEKAASEWLYVVPWGIRKVLNYIAQTYSNLPIYVTENGMDDEENNNLPLHEILDDKLRVRYFKGYLAAVAQAIKDGADVRGYFAWSLLDNFEWAQGYTKRFGLVYVDYKNGLTRLPKSSAYWFSRFLKGGEKKSGKED